MSSGIDGLGKPVPLPQLVGFEVGVGSVVQRTTFPSFAQCRIRLGTAYAFASSQMEST